MGPRQEPHFHRVSLLLSISSTIGLVSSVPPRRINLSATSILAYRAPESHRRRASVTRASLAYQDSNLEQRYQKPPCYQLHHRPFAAVAPCLPNLEEGIHSGGTGANVHQPEGLTGLEPARSAWKAEMLPITSQSRIPLHPDHRARGCDRNQTSTGCHGCASRCAN